MNDTKPTLLTLKLEAEKSRKVLEELCEQLERFVELCRDVQALKEEGVIDLVYDSVLRLAASSKS